MNEQRNASEFVQHPELLLVQESKYLHVGKVRGGKYGREAESREACFISLGARFLSNDRHCDVGRTNIAVGERPPA